MVLPATYSGTGARENGNRRHIINVVPFPTFLLREVRSDFELEASRQSSNFDSDFHHLFRSVFSLPTSLVALSSLASLPYR